MLHAGAEVEQLQLSHLAPLRTNVHSNVAWFYVTVRAPLLVHVCCSLKQTRKQ